MGGELAFSEEGSVLDIWGVSLGDLEGGGGENGRRW